MRVAQEIFLASARAALLAILIVSCSDPKPMDPGEGGGDDDGGEVVSDLETCETQTVSSAADSCEPWQQEDLCQPKQFAASNGVLTTELDIAKKWQCVPSGSGTDWAMAPLLLRNYGVSYDGEKHFNYPGPTFRLERKAGPTAPTEGDRFKMVLTNDLGPTTVENQMLCRDDDSRFANDVAPNCFHGNETTNFHFHGFHVSPQPLQDYVLLKLYPEDTPGITNYRPDMTDEELRHLTAIGGSYRYGIDPLPYNQPEGTHWYHAHHHGATALQVINGMAGTFLIEGPFDTWLNEQYGYEPTGEPKLKDRLLVVQQINTILGGLGGTSPLINGQGNPMIPIAPGEVQRWRFVSATTQASAQLETQFTGLRVCQIEMDGVRFSPENYQRQPLLQATDGSIADGCLDSPNFVLSPGNRADFLVQLLPTDAETGTRMELMQRVMGNVGAEAMERMETQRNRAREPGAARLRAMAPSPLMTLRLTESSDEAMAFPSNLPPMPEFLEPPSPSGPAKELAYQMYGPSASNPAPVFKIDDMQVRECVPPKTTVTRGTDERWVVQNFWNDEPAVAGSGIAHPFHIHTNPFYVVRNGNAVYTSGDDGYAAGIWQDTIALPLTAADDPDPSKASSVELFMEFEDYTGGYVQHCHILGHEDRGMMTLVQALCPDTDAFGTPVADQPDNCEVSRPRLPICDTS